ncbi:Reverse transcriptases (RTs) from retrotransposons domain-containing protein [Elysia marginata]|uniref:Reverse transcriptases (RTs) from retrotransposons domain-containing protein n=1 Tax=Elysia marginata TaxID=1093978 RepID=A0AAV4JED9_9GAST|nr:Reverse transcriptases (RTs) from retrotransposons domain-containing protein [Elysia marginata]
MIPNPQPRLLTIFLTPFGRLGMNRLHFGISSAPEIFQRRISEILRDIKGVTYHIDAGLGDASTHSVREDCISIVLQRPQEAGLTRNEMCAFSKRSIRFPRSVQGFHADL